jgi:DNA-binding XRE family transcriptional regulator
MIGVIEQSITNWENGRGTPIISLYPGIIRFLGYYPFDHPLDTAAGLIDQCRYRLGLSYYNLGDVLGVHGSTVIDWKKAGVIFNRDCEEKMKELLNTQCLPL